MKRKLLLIIVALLPIQASAYDAYVNGIYYNLIPKGKAAEVTSISNNCYFGTIVIPESITCNDEVYSVISIGEKAFAYCDKLTSVTIPNSVTTIGSSAFDKCTGLTFITIPESVTSIGYGAFKRCTNLKKVIVPNLAAWCNISFGPGWSGSNPLYWAHHIFSDINTEIKDLVIPSSVTKISSSTFYGCSGLTSVTIGNEVTSIGSSAFYKCIGLTSVTIGNEVTSIGSMAFYECDGLTSVTIGNNVTTIEKSAFFGCISLKSVTIPIHVTSIGENAFYNCGSLKTVTIPNSVTSLGNSVFYGCSDLTSVTIGGSVTNIGAHTFANCTQLTDVYCYAENAPNTKSDAFEGSYIGYATLHVPVGSVNSYNSTSPWKDFGKIIPIEETPTSCIVFADANVKSLCVANWDTNKDGELSKDEAASVTSLGDVFKGNTSITSFNELQYFTRLNSINERAFSGCTSLTTIIIPNSVTRIIGYAFQGCCSLTSIDIPESVTSIRYSVFDGCCSLTSVTIPNGVTNISSYTFSDCSSLTTITIPNNVTSIDYCAFYKCGNLASVSIGSGVASIGDHTFAYCSQLTDVYCFAEKVPSTGSNVFSYSPIASATLHVPKGSVNLYKSTSPWSSFGSIVPLEDEIEDDTYIDGIYYNFSYNEAEVTNGAITYSGAVVIPESVAYKGKAYPVTSISEKAFYGCSNITAITIPASVTSVGDNAFKGCISLKYVSMEAPKNNKHYTRDSSDERWLDYVAISGTQGVNDSEDYPKMLDNEINTKWCVNRVNGPIYIEFDATCPIKPTGYVLTTGNDTQFNPGRNPKSWIIKGRNSTNGDWTILTIVSDGMLPSENYASKTFSLNTNSSYRYYRFEVTSLVSGTIFQLSEFCFIISDDNDEPIDEDTNVLVLGSNGSSPLFADCPLDSVFIGRNISYSTSSDKGYSPFYCNTSLRNVNISGVAKEVSSKEFYGCTNLKNIRIGDRITTIGDYAFYSCTGLEGIYCDAEQTPVVASNSFKNVDVSAVMLVAPDNSVALYKAHPIWGLFWVETETSINKISNEQLEIKNEAIAFYDINGRKLASPKKGINIIRMSDGTSRKVMVK